MRSLSFDCRRLGLLLSSFLSLLFFVLGFPKLLNQDIIPFLGVFFVVLHFAPRQFFNILGTFPSLTHFILCFTIYTLYSSRESTLFCFLFFFLLQVLSISGKFKLQDGRSALLRSLGYTVGELPQKFFTPSLAFLIVAIFLFTQYLLYLLFHISFYLLNIIPFFVLSYFLIYYTLQYNHKSAEVRANRRGHD